MPLIRYLLGCPGAEEPKPLQRIPDQELADAAYICMILGFTLGIPVLTPVAFILIPTEFTLYSLAVLSYALVASTLIITFWGAIRRRRAQARARRRRSGKIRP